MPQLPPQLPVSVLYREPKLLKVGAENVAHAIGDGVSVLYREPKLLKVFANAARQQEEEKFQCSTVSRNC